MAAALFVIVGASFTAYRWESRNTLATCQVCGRVVPKETAFQMDTAQGSIEACCPSCAMHFMLTHPGLVREALATDFTSGRMIPAPSAYCDEGGDVQYCTLHQPPMEREPQGVSERVYDRCLFALVAFASRDAAEAYRQRHGGRVLDYNETLTSLQRH
jgi:hypothetical protein